MSLLSPHRASPLLAALAALLFASGASAAGLPGPFWTGPMDAAAYTATADAEMSKAQEALDRLLAVKGPRTIDNTLVPYHLALLHSDNAGYQAGLVQSVHPDSALRAAAEAADQRASKFQSDLALNPEVYRALRSLMLAGADRETRYFVDKTLRDFRLSGVHRDPETRKQIAALKEELVVIGQEFERNIRSDSRTIQVTPAELEGLPGDYVASHPPGPDGKISISIEYPDYFPVMNYAKNVDVRRRLYLESMNRAYPQNLAVLDRMLAKRHELATLLGFHSWADFVMQDKMIGSEKRASEFIARIRDLTLRAAAAEYEQYLKRKREDDPGAIAVDIWERRYLGEQIRKRDYAFDSQEARAYLPFARVKQGVLDVTGRLFGLTYRRVEGAPVWHPSVEAYEAWDGDRLIGRFYFDLHPRADKFNHAAQFGIRRGVAGLQLPEAALVCNFPGDRPDDPGLMDHADVVTFFHEFGHLLHSLLGGDQRWEPISGISMEWDFVEAPSQMLEEWARDPAVLATFAKHHQTGEPIPADLVVRMRRADTFGRAVQTAFQVFYSAVSLDLYSRDPKGLDTDARVAEIEPLYSPFPVPPGTHMQTSFGHLGGYSASYYTYQWSLVISKDLFSRFDRANLFEPGIARRYRERILAPGGSRPAAELVRSFLGRDFGYEAYERWLRAKD